MAKVPESVRANFTAFAASLPGALAGNLLVLSNHDKLLESYCRLACFNALKRDLVEVRFSEGACRFFHESHNDLLTSHARGHEAAESTRRSLVRHR